MIARHYSPAPAPPGAENDADLTQIKPGVSAPLIS